MILDGFFNWGIPDITNSTAATVSTNVTDAGSAKLVFVARRAARLKFKTVITADAAPTIKVDVVGADNTALTSNPIVIASTGVIATKDGLDTALASGDTVERDFAITNQQVAKCYYGLIVTLGGTNPDTVAATSHAEVMLDAQTNMTGPRAAVP